MRISMCLRRRRQLMQCAMDTRAAQALLCLRAYSAMCMAVARYVPFHRLLFHSTLLAIDSEWLPLSCLANGQVHVLKSGQPACQRN